MAVYRDAQHMREILSETIERIKDTDAAIGLQKTKLVVAFVYRNPYLAVILDGRTPDPSGAPVSYRFDDAESKPDVTFELAADVGHQFWMGKVNVPMALARGQIKARGAIASALKLIPLLPPLYKAYQEVLHERGETALLG